MAATSSHAARDSAIGSPRSQRSVTLTTKGSIPAPADENASNVDPVGLDSGVAAQQPLIARLSRNSKSFSKLGQLAKRAIGKHSINDPQRRAEEGRPSASARGLSPLSPAGLSSQTIHDTGAYEGTTIVSHDSHEVLATTQQFGSPVYVEPKPTNDYAKMEPSFASIVSFNAFIQSVRIFLHKLNDLPWVAERVTIDYVPGGKKGRRRPRVIQRPQSWYEHSLFSDSASPTSQPLQAQLPPRTPLQPLALDRSVSAREPPRTSPPQPEVSWQIIDPANPSDAPYATVVPADWSFHQPMPSEHLEPTIPTQTPHSTSRFPPEPQPAVNPPPSIPQQPASTWSYPGRPTDGYQRLVPIGETFPTGYVPYAHLESIEAAYQDRRFHPRPQDSAPQDPATQQNVPASAGVGVTQTVQDGSGMDTPQTARGLNQPFTTSSEQAGGTSLPASSFPTPYSPNAQPPVVAPTPRNASWSTAPTPGVFLSNIEATPRAAVVLLGSPQISSSAAASRAERTTQRNHGRAPSVHTVQSEHRLPSVASSHVSRVPSAVNQTRNRPPSLAPSHVSRSPSAAAPAMSQTPNRPPSVALSNASQARSVRASQSRPVSVARSHVSHAPSVGAHTPELMQSPRPVIPSTA